MARSKKRSRLTLPLVLFFLFFVFVLANRSERESPWYERFFWAATAIPARVATASSQWVSGIWQHYIFLVDVSKHNVKLQQQNEQLRGQVVQLEEIMQENARLRKLLKYPQEQNWQVLTARVIGNDPRAQFKSLLINRGKADGLRLLQPVVVGDGLVGRIGKLGSHSALVLLVTDPNSAVDVLVQRSRARALLVGSTRAELGSTKLEYLKRSDDVQKDDVVVTSGFDGLYPPGLPVGKIVRVESSASDVFHDAELKPFVDFESLQEVSVLLLAPQHYE